MSKPQSGLTRFYGKYRGTVINNVDPMQMGRLQVQVPDVAGLLPTSWAMPCFPFGGQTDGNVGCSPDWSGRLGGV